MRAIADDAHGEPRLRVVGLYDPDAELCDRVAADWAVPRVARTYGELLDQDLDAVYLASPNHVHAPQACLALRRGVHVLSEIPAIVSLEQAHELVAAARISRAQYMLAENFTYTPPNRTVTAMVDAGLFGKLYFGDSEYVQNVHAGGRDIAPPGSWQAHWHVGRNAFTYPTHLLGPLLRWFGTRVTAVCCAGGGRHAGHPMEDTLVLLGRTEDGGLIRLRLDLLSPRPPDMFSYAVQGTAGAFECGRGSVGRVYVEGRSRHRQWEPVEEYARAFGVPWSEAGWTSPLAPTRDFAAALVAGASSPLDIHRALDMTLPGLVSGDSLALGGAWIPVPDSRFFTDGLAPDTIQP